ncbi:hypothetical protein DASC09_035690 [Saccharomycopsis crataegensis]|uniref:Uncharacterized protein n=1 Tax=Saccharomycopsis crataegensis TaxID=43959 RepID=A0AAV5QNJ7_9ASCO|nr:hypothetical protein DASC09_035690 [Saccharomycopsis crataegensis]
METVKEHRSNDHDLKDEKVNYDIETSEVFESKENPELQQIDIETGVRIEEIDPNENSIYPEVRAAIPNTDDPSIPHNTIRAWFIGLLMCTLGAGLNMFFSLRAPSFSISVFVTTIIAWPIGAAWHKCLPEINIFGVPLNPGPFNLKEHSLITIMANVSFGVAYCTDILLAMNNYYKKDFGWGFNILALLSTQCIGLSLGGLARKVLVSPPSMVWPSNLITATFLTNIHINDNQPANGWTVSRLKFFAFAFIASFCWYFIPGYLFQALSSFAFMTWIFPQNAVVNQLFGATTGLGMIPVTFDWYQIAGYLGSPLIPPASAIFTILLSMITIFWIVCPALHYSNVWHSKYLPMSDSNTYDRFQQVYNVSRIVDEKLSFNEAEYNKYSPIYLSTTFSISYGLSFAAITATIVHTLLFHSKDIMKQLKSKEKEDVHNRLMRAYKECPDWWYAVVFVIFLAFAIVAMRCWDTEMPIWSVFVALAISFLFLFPVGIIAAITNISIGLNVLTEFIIGYMVPGKPICMMFFKTFGYITNAQAVTFASDMKLGYYMKISPRVMFAAQFAATIWGSFVQLFVMKWAQGNIKGVCTEHQENKFSCPNANVFYSASILWGVIGPQKLFSQGQLYYGLMFFFIIGMILPFVNWLILRKWPNSPVKWLNWPVFFSGTGYIPPASPYNYGTWCMVGLIFNWFIKKKWFAWWSKYNYSLSAGLDIGLAWSSLLIFFCLTFTQVAAPKWWGNTVIENTMDATDTAFNIVLKDGEFFGPSSW